MIEYVASSGTPGALNCPAFICDICGKQVVKSGNIHWGKNHGRWDGQDFVRPEGEPWKATPLFVTHKQPCTRAFDAWFKAAYPREEGWLPAWEELEHFLGYLKHNAESDFREELEESSNVEFHAHQVVFPAVPIPGQFVGIGHYEKGKR